MILTLEPRGGNYEGQQSGPKQRRLYLSKTVVRALGKTALIRHPRVMSRQVP